MYGFFRRLALSIVILAGGAGLGQAHAADALSKPAGDVVLTVSGAIAVHNDDSSAVFDMAMLEALPPAEIKTETPWTDGMITFTGFKLADLLSLVGVRGGTLTAYALNDYEAEVPVEDAEKYGIIVAYRMNGKAMPASDKGPFWIIYPFSDDAALQTETYYARSSWNLEGFVAK